MDPAEERPPERASESAENAGDSVPAQTSETKSLEGSDAEQDKPSSTGDNWLQKLSNNSKALFTALSSSLLLVLLLALTVSLGIELGRSTVVLDLLEVPKELRDDGLTSVAVSQKLADELAKIQRISLSKNPQRLLEPAWEQRDIQVPGSSISFRSISQWLKQKLGIQLVKKDIHLTGELIKENSAYNLTLRRTDEAMDGNYFETVWGKTLPAVITLSGESLAKLADPATLASYYFFLEDRDDGYQKTIATIKYVIGTGDVQAKARAYNLWGNVLADQDDGKHATSMYEAAISYDNELGEAYVNWGNTLLFELNDPANAIGKFKTAIHMNPKLASAYNGLGLALDAIEKPTEAFKNFQKAVKYAGPTDYWSYVNKANLLSSIGRRQEALPVYQKARELIEEKIYRDETTNDLNTGIRTHDLDAYEALCNILTSTGDFSDAVKSGEAAVKIDRTSPEAHRCLGVALQNVGRLEDSESHLRRTLALRATWYWAQNDLGNTLMRRGSFHEAEKVYRPLVRQFPTFAWGWFNLGRAYFEKGDHTEALEYFEKAAGIHPRAGSITAQIAEYLLEDGKYILAEKPARKAIIVNNNDLIFHSILADILNRLGNTEDGEIESSMVADLAARLDAAHRRMNDNYGLTSDEYAIWGWALAPEPEAKEKFEHALKIDPANTSASVGLAKILVASENTAQAIITLKAVNKINPNDYFVHVALGNAFVAAGLIDEAAKEFNRALEINGHFPDALLADARRLSSDGNNLGALERAKQAAEIVPESKEARLAVDRYKAALAPH